jgi:hypothetical protein
VHFCSYLRDRLLYTGRLHRLPGDSILIEHLFMVSRTDVRKRARKSHVVGFEGHLTDFINGLNVELPIHDFNGRTEAVIASFPDAVPPDMRDVPYRPLTLAHQHKQGTASRNSPAR